MTIKIHCSDCGKAYKVPDDAVGKRFTCKKCGQVIEVPGSVASADDDPLDGLANTDFGNASYDDLEMGDDLETGDDPAPAGRRRSSGGSDDDDYRGGSPPGSGLAIASLVLGIISLLASCTGCVGLPLAVTAIVLGAIARSQASSGKASGAGMALAGILCGVGGLLISITVLAAFFAGGLAAIFPGNAKFEQEFEKQMQQMEQEIEGEKQVIPISGKVTCNGEPVTDGRVMFVPDADPGVDNPGKPASGLLNENGEFELTTYVKGDGVVVGKHHVSVTRRPNEEEIRAADEDDFDDAPRVYLCGGKNKSYEIKKGDTEIIIELMGRLEPGGDDDDDDDD